MSYGTPSDISNSVTVHSPEPVAQFGSPNSQIENLPPDPYPGLRPFQRQESAIFFGRGVQIAEMLTRLEEHRFLAVVGASGCGKSSLVRAGLLPALDQGFLAASSERWRFIIMQPGKAPLRNLACELLRGLRPQSAVDEPEPDLDRIAFVQASLRSGPKGMSQVVADASLPQHTNVLVLVDQFEEFFRFRNPRESSEDNASDGSSAAQRDEAALLVSLLLATAAQRDLPIYVVITMRSDFLGDCDAFYGLPEAINASQFLTPRLTRDQARDAIVGPARLFGGDVEPALVNQILNEIGNAPDQLPLMQHALMRSWTLALNSHGASSTAPPRLTLEQFTDPRVGGIAKALDRHAEETYMQLGDVPPVGATEEDVRASVEEKSAPWAKELLRFIFYLKPALREEFAKLAIERPADWELAEREAAEHPAPIRVMQQALLREVRLVFQIPNVPPQSLQQRVSEKIFRCLSDKNLDDERVIRRLATIQEIADVSGVSVDEVIVVAEPFLDHGCSLLTSSPTGTLTPETTLDVSHEVLLRQWSRLKGWIKTEQESAETFRDVAKKARRWKANLTSRWSDVDLRPVERWLRIEQPTAAWARRYARTDGSQADFEESMRFLKHSRRWSNIWSIGLFAVGYLAVFSMLYRFINWIESIGRI